MKTGDNVVCFYLRFLPQGGTFYEEQIWLWRSVKDSGLTFWAKELTCASSIEDSGLQFYELFLIVYAERRLAVFPCVFICF